MQTVTISLAQIPVEKGNWAVNLATHLTMIRQACAENADVVVFPELSLTGYELELAAELALPPEPSHFQALSQAAVEHNLIVIAGCPLISAHGSQPNIGAVICFADGEIQFYAKQYLHPGEERYCSPGTMDYIFDVKGHRIALAICADFTAAEHARQARRAGVDAYIVSALISEKGFVADAERLSSIASEHRIPVLLSNHISVTGGWQACGNNSVWDTYGQLVASSGSADAGLVLCILKGNDITASPR